MAAIKPANIEKPLARAEEFSPAPFKAHLFSVDFLRFYAVLQVLLVHSSGPWMSMIGAKNPWWAACLIDSLSRSAVPLFLMVSGMLLLQNEKVHEPLSRFLLRRGARVFIPLLAWSAIFIFYRLLHNPQNILTANPVALLSTPAAYHLFYLYYLGGLYLATPILRVFVNYARPSEIRYFVILWFFAQSLLPMTTYFTGWQPPVIFSGVSLFSGYFILGYLLRDFQIASAQRIPALLALVSSAACTIFGTYLISTCGPHKALNQLFFEYNSPNVVIYSVLTFVLLRSINFNNFSRPVSRIVSSISAASFTIYLVHPLFIDQIRDAAMGLYALPVNKFVLTSIAIFITAATACSAGWLFYWTCKKLRAPSWLIP